MHIRRTVASPLPPHRVFAYLSDFTSTEEWDPGTLRTTRESGDGGVGTRYRNVSRFLGRRVELEYVVEEHDRPRRLRLRGTGRSVVSWDTMDLVPTPDGGTELRYHARFDFSGPARFLAPLLAPAFRRLGDDAESRLREVLVDAAP